MTDPNPMDSLKQLADRIREVCKDEGIELARFAAVSDGEPHLELMFSLDPAWHKPDEFDDILAGMEEATRQAELEAQAEETRKGLEGLKEQLKSPTDGIL